MPPLSRLPTAVRGPVVEYWSKVDDGERVRVNTGRRADHYEWFTGYLDRRGVTTIVRVLMAFIALSMSLCLIALLLGPDRPVGRPATVAMWIAVAGGLIGAVLWSVRMPSRAQSRAFAAVSTVSIALACLSYADPTAALVGCIAFATIGAYLAFFHSTVLVLANFAAAAGVATVQAVRLAAAGHVALGVVDLWLVLQINIAMPLAIHVLLRTIGDDLLRADLDPLTGLLNRRAFRVETVALIARRKPTHRHLMVALVDLDDFKAINDTHGHSAGDSVLVQVADVMRASVRDTALVARSGGEEFLIADVALSDDLADQCHAVCEAIAALSVGVTASIGSVRVVLDHAPRDIQMAIVDDLVATADDAMYRAKRNGGNQCHHHGTGPRGDERPAVP